MDETTKKNLLDAMHGEAFAHAKYLLFAARARRAGRPELAELFEKTARQELSEHFAEEAELAGLVQSDEDNVRSAIRGEAWEVDHMYRDYAEQARLAGDTAAAARFEEIRQDEMVHRGAFEAALVDLEVAGAVI